MGALAEGIFAGVLANGITALVGRLGSRRSPRQRAFKPIEQTLAKAAANAAREIDRQINIANDKDGDALKRFLISPYVDTLVRRLYMDTPLGNAGELITATRREFHALFDLHFQGRTPPAIGPDQLFDCLQGACEKTLQYAVDQGELNAFEALESWRHHLVLARVEDIAANVSFLTGRTVPTPEQILAFQRDYHADARERFGYLTPPSFNEQRRVPIDELFVHPMFSLIGEGIQENREPPENDIQRMKISMDDLMFRIHRTVILGSPGGGKTTFARKLVQVLASCSDDRPVAGRSLTPFLVKLKDYAAEKSKSSLSVMQFIESRVNGDHQINPAAGTIEFVLRTGSALVVFDGLDELLETTRRREVSDNVESFCRRYPETAVLVTSREVGYQQAPLDQSLFTTFHIETFSHEQIVDYAKKWFAYDRREVEAEAFVEESAVAPDLRENPMLLALLCTLYRGPGTLPRNRPEVYERCSQMLFDRWDRDRDICHPVPYPSHLFWAMQHLAHWIYTDPALRGGVTEHQLTTTTQQYLLDRCTEDVAEAETAANDFVAFCRGRAWVFTDTGSTADGEPIYEFTHRTFLEYFTARHLVRNHPSPDALTDILLPRIEKQEWDMVTQLAFHILSREQSEAADRLIDHLLTRSMANENAAWELFHFAGRCLAFLTPRPRIVRQLTRAFIDRWLNSLIHELLESKVLTYLIRPYLCALPENRNAVSDTFLDAFSKAMTKGVSGWERIAQIALGIPFHLFTGDISREINQFWNDFSRLFCEHNQQAIEDLAEHNFEVAFYRPCGKRASLVLLWHRFGFNSLYRRMTSFGESSRGYVSPVGLVLWDYLDIQKEPENEREKKYEKAFSEAAELAPLLLKAPLPWVGEAPTGFFEGLYRYLLFSKPVAMETLGIPVGTAFALFSFFAFAIDAELSKGVAIENLRNQLGQMVDENHRPEFAFCALARLNGEFLPPELPEHLARCFSDEQYTFIRRWVQGEIRLVGTGGAIGAKL